MHLEHFLEESVYPKLCITDVDKLRHLVVDDSNKKCIYLNCPRCSQKAHTNEGTGKIVCLPCGSPMSFFEALKQLNTSPAQSLYFLSKASDVRIPKHYYQMEKHQIESVGQAYKVLFDDIEEQNSDLSQAVLNQLKLMGWPQWLVEKAPIGIMTESMARHFKDLEQGDLASYLVLPETLSMNRHFLIWTANNKLHIVGSDCDYLMSPPSDWPPAYLFHPLCLRSDHLVICDNSFVAANLICRGIPAVGVGKHISAECISSILKRNRYKWCVYLGDQFSHNALMLKSSLPTMILHIDQNKVPESDNLSSAFFLMKLCKDDIAQMEHRAIRELEAILAPGIVTEESESLSDIVDAFQSKSPELSVLFSFAQKI